MNTSFLSAWPTHEILLDGGRNTSAGVLLQIVTQCGGDLVGAGGGLHTATNTGEAINGLLDRHTDKQTGNALRVSGASSGEFYLTDHAVLNIDIDLAKADRLWCVADMFHDGFLSKK